MRADWAAAGATAGTATLRVDGGMSASDFAMQALADILGAPVDRPKVIETTALGAGWLAGMRAGLYPGPAEFAASWALEHRFEPRMPEDRRESIYAGWRDAVRRVLVKRPGAGEEGK
jgi:glycerol kinase